MNTKQKEEFIKKICKANDLLRKANEYKDATIDRLKAEIKELKND